MVSGKYSTTLTFKISSDRQPNEALIEFIGLLPSMVAKILKLLQEFFEKHEINILHKSFNLSWLKVCAAIQYNAVPSGIEEHLIPQGNAFSISYLPIISKHSSV